MNPVLRIFAALSVLLVIVQARNAPLSIPLKQRGTTNADLVKQTLHAVSKRTVGDYTLVPEALDAGFWYGNFDVGDSKNLSLLIDTGSADVAINPSLYCESLAGINLNSSGSLGYVGSGCGAYEIAYHTFADTVSVAGLTVHNQTLGAVTRTTPRNNGTITQFPHDGIVGFSGVSPGDTQLGGVTVFPEPV
ncbi:hypothetical protein LTR17_006599 [Elasticomyces elasticus]|nr:hypothetical protein LTR17_006599 [Elasticomyces elasticus]